MHRKEVSHKVRSFRFHQWSRKAYAAFASLKRHVTMGCVGKGITEVSLSKGAMRAQVCVSRTCTENDAVTDVGESQIDTGEAALLLLQSSMPICMASVEGGSRPKEREKRNNLLIKAYCAEICVRKAQQHRAYASFMLLCLLFFISLW